jgi:squalene-associated FAD-dependent desaturase
MTPTTTSTAEQARTSSSLIPNPSSLLIVGGGLAGLSAAVALASRGFRITLIESRPQLGGRAGSFEDSQTEELIDNCQHVGLGCCTNWLDFCRAIGMGDALARYDRFVYQEPGGRRSTLGTSRLPAPFHLTPSLLKLKFLTFGEKLRLAYGVGRMVFANNVADSVGLWLRRHGQTERIIRRFWGPILTSALNESLDFIDFEYARQVIVEAFLVHRDGASMFVPSVPLGELYGTPLKRWLADHGVVIRTGVAATELVMEGKDRIRSVRTRAEELTADYYLLAVPPNRATSLLPEAVVERHPIFAALQNFQFSPITSVHCWFDRPVMDVPHLTPLDVTTQWLFRRDEKASGGRESAGGELFEGQQQGTDVPRSPGHYIQAVISASRGLSSLGKEAIRDKIVAEIREILPAAKEANLVHCRVVTERSATYSILPGVDDIRPSPATPIGNLFLAGDYVQTRWPATMEGAVRSGRLAAEAILAAVGRPEGLVTEGLPIGRFSAWLLRSPSRTAKMKTPVAR